jgi:hypothetical protein
MEDARYISYNNQKCVVFSVMYKNKLKLPALLDYDDFIKISKLNKNWRCNENGFVVCSHTHNGTTQDVTLQKIVMLLHNGNNDQKKKILHINRIGLDNRMENLMYDTQDKCINKNIKKKKRTVCLPKNCGINPDDIPTYIWYMAPDETHGARFIVKIGDITNVTTSSKDISLNDKLEEAKSFLKKLFEDREDLREDYSMNGDYNILGKDLLNSYYDIVKKAGYDHIKKSIPEHNTNKLLG